MFQLLVDVRGFPVSPRDQDSACHLRNAVPLDMSGPCHGRRIEDGWPGLKELERKTYLLKNEKKAAGAKPHPPAAVVEPGEALEPGY